jgi:hypothetical protein
MLGDVNTILLLTTSPCSLPPLTLIVSLLIAHIIFPIGYIDQNPLGSRVINPKRFIPHNDIFQKIKKYKITRVTANTNQIMFFFTQYIHNSFFVPWSNFFDYSLMRRALYSVWVKSS